MDESLACLILGAKKIGHDWQAAGTGWVFLYQLVVQQQFDFSDSHRRRAFQALPPPSLSTLIKLLFAKIHSLVCSLQTA